MPYCLICDVELAPTEKFCPLCGAPACDPPDPAAAPPESLPEHVVSDPRHASVQEVSRCSTLLLLSLPFLMAALIYLVCDINVHGHPMWVGVVTAGLGLSYLVAVVPPVLHTPPLLQLCLDLAASELFLFYIAQKMQGPWFWPFAFPIALAPFACAILLVLIRYFSGLDALKIAALSTLATGFYCMLIEWRINVVFLGRTHFVWAMYPLIVFLIISAILFLASRDEMLKATLARRFFI